MGHAGRPGEPGAVQLAASPMTTTSVTCPPARRSTATANGQLLVHLAGLLDHAELADDGLIRHLLDTEVDGERLTREEVLLNCLNLSIAGNETTKNATTGGLVAFARNPDQWQLLRRRPELLDSAVEEILRYTSPLQHVTRTVLQPTTLACADLNPGDLLCVWIASANRDEDVFGEPDTFRVDRDPNPHLAFTAGKHFCLGASLSRMEIRLVFESLLARVESIRLLGPPIRKPTNVVAAYASLPVALQAGLTMTFDLVRARAETPGVIHIAHLNNAGASLAPKPVIDAVMDHLRLESEVGPYEAAERAQEAVEYGHAAVAALLNCDSQEVAMFDSASRAWGMALSSLPLRAGDRVLISPMEYGSCYLSLLHLARRRGVRVEVLPVLADGLVCMEELRARLDERVKLIAMTHVPTHDGLVYPVALIGQVAREHGIPFLVDACQSVGQIPVDVKEIGCDMLVGAGRKYLRGPRGTGFLFVRRQLAEQLMPAVVGLDGVEWAVEGYRFAPAARRFDTWETNCAARIGLGVAIDYALGWGVEQHLAEDPATGRGPARGDHRHPGGDGARPWSGTLRNRRHHRAGLGRGVGQGGAAPGRHQHVGVPGELRLRRHATAGPRQPVADLGALLQLAGGVGPPVLGARVTDR